MASNISSLFSLHSDSSGAVNLPARVANTIMSFVRRETGPPSAAVLDRLLTAIHQQHPNVPSLPTDVRVIIIDMIRGDWDNRDRRADQQLQRARWHPALTPPSHGASPFMSLPAELRRHILTESLPARNTTFYPLCDDQEADMKKKAKLTDTSRKIDKTAHTIPNLMTVCKTLRDEIAEVIYEERTFVIHVHEGLKSGGVEILHAGRQPLQYQDCATDQRFAKFKKGDEFGFQRMKKLVIQIHPTTEDGDRHLAINTHFMNVALCRLLERPNNDKDRITSIKIEFAKRKTGSAIGVLSRAAIQRQEQPWMDLNGPKCSSIYNVSDIELALRPFAILTRCHSASIKLPPYLANDEHLLNFVANLTQSMESKTGTLMPDDRLEHNIECMREEMENHVLNLLYGTETRTDVPKLTDKEVAEDGTKESEYADSDVDNEFRMLTASDTVSARTRSKKKHGRSPASSTIAGSLPKRLKEAKQRLSNVPKGMVNNRGALVKQVQDAIRDAGILVSTEEFDQMVEEQITMIELLPDAGDSSSGSEADSDDDWSVTGKPERRKGRQPKAKARKSTTRTTQSAVEDEDDWELDLAKQLSSGTITAHQARKILGNEIQPLNSSQQTRPTASTDSGDNDHTMRHDSYRDRPMSAPLPPLEDMGVKLDYGVPPAPRTDNGPFAPIRSTTSGMPHRYPAFARTRSMASGPFAPYQPFRPNALAVAMHTPPTPTLPASTMHAGPTSTMFSGPRPLFTAHASPVPRAFVQAEDSGIGMLASDDGKEEKEEDTGDEAMAKVRHDAEMEFEEFVDGSAPI